MSTYAMTTVTEGDFTTAVEAVTNGLQMQGFGILTEIDVRKTMKTKLGVEIPDYRILGACNPPFAYAALKAEELAGVFLPCNVVVHDLGNHEIEITAIDPVAAMASVSNPRLQAVAEQIRERLERVINEV